jgi:hypothetical protein
VLGDIAIGAATLRLRFAGTLVDTPTLKAFGLAASAFVDTPTLKALRLAASAFVNAATLKALGFAASALANAVTLALILAPTPVAARPVLLVGGEASDDREQQENAGTHPESLPPGENRQSDEEDGHDRHRQA